MNCYWTSDYWPRGETVNAVYLQGREGWEAAWLAGLAEVPRLRMGGLERWWRNERSHSPFPRLEGFCRCPNLTGWGKVATGRGRPWVGWEGMTVLPRDPWCGLTRWRLLLAIPWGSHALPTTVTAPYRPTQRYILSLLSDSQYLRPCTLVFISACEKFILCCKYWWQ